jgi:hypothetical protein
MINIIKNDLFHLKIIKYSDINNIYNEIYIKKMKTISNIISFYIKDEWILQYNLNDNQLTIRLSFIKIMMPKYNWNYNDIEDFFKKILKEKFNI